MNAGTPLRFGPAYEGNPASQPVAQWSSTETYANSRWRPPCYGRVKPLFSVVCVLAFRELPELHFVSVRPTKAT
ncbi:hypothetical protein RB132 [Rhodopirellula baltica SH 1]|uniref:Uncharacterized protein n=1 Tax=Rhodopirellula baltica (strain DSM 10527 / NCIMB 13988 / SH1) TaxID=243090 RepID=Q7UZ80_RHOBA|nr:hypothetical protein RB132 [Rhodopirellula baltica SH 1]